MATETPKYFLLCNGLCVLDNADEPAVNAKIEELLSGTNTIADRAIDHSSFQLLQGRYVPIQVETGIRVKITKRVHKKAS